MKKVSVVVLSAIALLVTSSVSAQEASNSATARPKPAFRPQIQEFHQSIQENKEEFKARIEEKREEFQSKIAQLRDTRKQTILTMLEKRINSLNLKMTSVMKKHIERLNKINDKMASRAAKIRERGGNVASAEAQIAQVRADLTSLSAAVDAQATASYTPSITATDAASLKDAFSGVHEQFKADMKALRDQFKAVLEKMHSVLRILEGVQKGLGTTTNEEKSGTNSAVEAQ